MGIFKSIKNTHGNKCNWFVYVDENQSGTNRSDHRVHIYQYIFIL